MQKVRWIILAIITVILLCACAACDKQVRGRIVCAMKS